MPIQTLPSSATEYARSQRAEIGAAVSATKRLWRRVGPDFGTTYAAVEPSLLAVVQTAQGRVAEGAAAYIPAVLEETGQRRAAAAFADADPGALVGYAGDGRPVDGLLYGSVVHAKQEVAAGRSARQALASSSQWLSMAVGTLLSDTARQSESLGMAVRPVGGYVRMLNPPSCSRCAVLAGRWYRSNAGFERHPGCDCRHIPASESLAGDLTVDTGAYFDSLSDAEQDRIFTKAGAEAIRDGADINQVVNARRGMRTSQVNTTSGWVPRGRLAPVRIGGQDVFVTTEATARRGAASRVVTGRRGARLMPETIVKIATDREDRLRLLRVNGYLR